MQQKITEITEAVSLNIQDKLPPVSLSVDVSSSKFSIVVNIVQIILRLLSKIIMPFFYKLETRGRENVKGLTGPVLLISNHKSYFDPLIMADSLPFWSQLFPIRFIAKDQFFQSIISKIFFVLIGAYPAYYRQGINKSLATPLNILGKKGSVVFFPEGKCVRSDELGEGKVGAAVLALQVPELSILPIAIKNSHHVRNDGRKIPTVKTSIGKPFRLENRLVSPALATPEAVTALFMDEIKKLYSEV